MKLWLLPAQVANIPPEWHWREGIHYEVMAMAVPYTEKPWFFKAGRLNMMSGEPWGVYLHTPWFAIALSNHGVHFPS